MCWKLRLFCSQQQNDCDSWHKFKDYSQSLHKSSVSCVLYHWMHSAGELDELIKINWGVFSVVVAIIIRPNNAMEMSCRHEKWRSWYLVKHDEVNCLKWSLQVVFDWCILILFENMMRSTWQGQSHLVVCDWCISILFDILHFHNIDLWHEVRVFALLEMQKRYWLFLYLRHIIRLECLRLYWCQW